MVLEPAAGSESLVLVGYGLIGALIAGALLAVLIKTGTLSARPGPALAPGNFASSIDAPWTCALHATPESCDRCMNDKCRAPCEACASDARCLRLYVCLVDCADDKCPAACASQYPDGKRTLDVFAGEKGCMATLCRQACQ